MCLPGGRPVDPDQIEYLRHMQRAIATGRSNRHFRLQPRQGREIQKGNMGKVAAACAIWSRGEAHVSAEARQYLSMLDVGNGSGIVQGAEQVWPAYGEAVRDRKLCVGAMALRHLANSGIRQVVILGAGLDALSVEIAARTGNSVVSYEVDASTMPYKRRVLEASGSRAAQHVRCITANLVTAGPGRIASALAREGWDYDRPSLVVAEGISYYVPKQKLANLLGYFRTRDGSGRLVQEYVRDAGSIFYDRAPIPERILGMCGSLFGVDRLSRFSDAQALDFAAGGTGRGGRAGVKAALKAGLRTVGPVEMEKANTGSNALFPGDDSGWFAVCHGPI